MAGDLMSGTILKIGDSPAWMKSGLDFRSRSDPSPSQMHRTDAPSATLVDGASFIAWEDAATNSNRF
jgi:hypothetical protein